MTGSGVSMHCTLRSAEEVTVVVVTAVLSAGFKSGPFAEAIAVFVTVPAVFAITEIEMVCKSSEANCPSTQVTMPFE